MDAVIEPTGTFALLDDAAAAVPAVKFHKAVPAVETTVTVVVLTHPSALVPVTVYVVVVVGVATTDAPVVADKLEAGDQE